MGIRWALYVPFALYLIAAELISMLRELNRKDEKQ